MLLMVWIRVGARRSHGNGDGNGEIHLKSVLRMRPARFCWYLTVYGMIGCHDEPGAEPRAARPRIVALGLFQIEGAEDIPLGMYAMRSLWPQFCKGGTKDRTLTL